LEIEEYLVEYGASVEPGPEPRGGMRVEHVGNDFLVSNGSVLRYTVPDNLQGFLSGVTTSSCQFIGTPRAGLFVRTTGRERQPIGGVGPNGLTIAGSVSRTGPLTVGLRFVESEPPGAKAESGSRSVVEMTFPSSKSWVELSWRLDDRAGSVTALGLELPLRLSGGTTLVDLGASSTVYGVLKGEERMVLSAGHAPGVKKNSRPWSVTKGLPGALSALAEAPRNDSPAAEGWAHVMDSTCCTALAVADFGRSTRDKIEIAANGRVLIEREYGHEPSATTARAKELRLWFHFVPRPVQVGAATSPQAMLAPLELHWLRGRPGRD
jgi:hypothetical protein